MRLPSSDRLIVALDFTKLSEAIRIAKQLRGLIHTVKVGSALFSACGPSAIYGLKRLGFDIMLDLKFFDIPSTVELSCKAATRHLVSLLTVHACGGEKMLLAAVRGCKEEAKLLRTKPPRILAVTILTSFGNGEKFCADKKAISLAKIALNAGCDGVVASAKEAAMLRRAFGRRLDVVCPGIRSAGANNNDQARVVSAKEALLSGADAIVVGRPITSALKPRLAAKAILDEMEGVSR